MCRSDERGFTLIELMIVILIFGMILGFSVPAVNRYRDSQMLKGACENFAAQVRLTREKAVATDRPQYMHVRPSGPMDYHMHNGSSTGPITVRFPFPRGITMVEPASAVRLEFRTDGTVDNSLDLVLADSRGNRDTVSVQTSGLVLTR